MPPHSSRADLDLNDEGVPQELARLELLFEAIPLAFATFDGELRLVNANARYRELTGSTRRSASHRSIYDAFPNALADLTDQIDSALAGVPVVAVRIPFQHRGGRRLIESRYVRSAIAHVEVPIAQCAGFSSPATTSPSEKSCVKTSRAASRSSSRSSTSFRIPCACSTPTDAPCARTRRRCRIIPSGHPSTLRELWQLDRPRTIDGTSLFMHEHPTARALRGERVRGETLAVRRGPDGAPVDHRGQLESALRRAREDPRRRHRRARRHGEDAARQALEEEARRTAELYERVSTEAERLERMVQERTQRAARAAGSARRASVASPRSASSPPASCTT